MKSLIISALLLVPVFSFQITAANPPDVAGSWRMTAHRVDPAQNGVTDVYTHFKDLYGGCQEDMGLVLNTDGTLKMTPVKGCQNPLGNLIMKAATKFMPSGKASWEVTGSKLALQDGKGNRREYDLQLSGTTMTWVFDEAQKEGAVRHTIEFQHN
ncbi:hypothetical protein [Spirosoma radiotolerans]|uniref:Lipocalin-like domain-containing protein n=1 Tax=Spirosoma radiotolerans TaxID=1379870 RepID=A0A0E3ZXF2_9BACT|nr:hypothetical protein [Spirosoma radiotolerans]AKD56375.1 hypothetical protein SD10_17125 [Spirosoma radiotolerans]